MSRGPGALPPPGGAGTALVPGAGALVRPGSSYGPPEWPADEGIEVQHLLGVLVARKWQILAVALLVLVPAIVATLLQERLYESFTIIEVAGEPVQVLPYGDVASQATSGNTAAVMASKEEMLRGALVASQVAERLRAQKGDPQLMREADRLRQQVSVFPLPNTQMIRVSYLAGSPDAAARIANLWAEEFIKANFASRQETRQKVRHLLQRELATLEQQVQASEQALVRYAQEHGMTAEQAGDGDLAQVKLSTLAAALTAAESTVIEAKSRLDMLQSASLANFPEKLNTQSIGTRQIALLQLEHELTGMRSTYGPNWPSVVQKRNEVALVREQLEREKTSALAAAREQARLEYRAADDKRQMLADSKAEQDRLVARLQDASIQYNNIRREVQTNQKLYEGLLERLKQTGVAPGMDLENIRIIEPARASDVLAQPRILWNLFLASMLGLGLGVSIAYGREFWLDAPSTPEQVERSTGVPVLGSIPLIERAVDARRTTDRLLERPLPAVSAHAAALSAVAPPPSSVVEAVARLETSPPEVSEAVRQVCASILLSRSEHHPRTLLVTSALPGEGKTTVVAQLGLALAEAGCRTLLVECDLRRPTFTSILGLSPDQGLSLFLAGHADRPRLQGVLNGTLAAVVAGPVPPNPVSLLHSQRMRGFLDEMMQSFQFVILDGPPVLPIADARMLGALSEGVVLVVRAGATSRKEVQRACAALSAGGSYLLGTILNGTSSASSSYQRYYRHDAH